MATYEHRLAENEDNPSIVERIEVRPWRYWAVKAIRNLWSGAGQISTQAATFWSRSFTRSTMCRSFYTRNFIHHIDYGLPVLEDDDWIEKFRNGERDGYGFGDMLPETSVFFQREKQPYKDANNEDQFHINSSLEISADTGAIFGKAGPGRRSHRDQDQTYLD